MRDRCKFCGCVVHGTHHYGSLETCERIKKLQQLIARHHAARPDSQKEVACYICRDARV